MIEKQISLAVSVDWLVMCLPKHGQGPDLGPQAPHTTLAYNPSTKRNTGRSLRRSELSSATEGV